jgi:hypothetical protein
VNIIRKNYVRPSAASQFKAEQWTIVSDREVWATIMLDGPDKGQPCAFGPKGDMEKYAQRLNESKGELK